MLSTYFLVGLGGLLGTLARFGVAQLWRTVAVTFPVATLSVNVIGCFLIAGFTYLAEKKNWISSDARLFLTAGFCGGFTTFSSLILEMVKMQKDGHLLLSVGYLLLSVASGLGAFFLAEYALKRFF
jgi:CrcB protein